MILDTDYNHLQNFPSRLQKKRHSVKNASRNTSNASRSERSDRRSGKRTVTGSAIRAVTVPMNGGDRAVASGNGDVTRRRLEIEQINYLKKLTSTSIKLKRKTATETSSGFHYYPNLSKIFSSVFAHSNTSAVVIFNLKSNVLQFEYFLLTF